MGRLHFFAYGMASSAALAVAAGCLLTTPLDGLEGTAAAPSMESGSTGAADGPTGDRGPGADGSVAVTPDAGPDADAASMFRCAALPAPPTFCTDFDMGTIVSIFGGSTTSNGGAVTLDDTLYRSPSQSLKVTIPSLPTGAPTTKAFVLHSFGFAPTSAIDVEFDLHVDSPDKSSSNTLAIAMGSYQLALFIGDSAKVRQAIPSDGGVLYPATNVSAPPAGTWVHVSFVVALAPGASTVTLSFDGVAQGPFPVLTEQYLTPSWSISVGSTFVSAPDLGRELHIDNLIFDVK
jgi:hypothetical protein